MKILIEIKGQEETALVALAKDEDRSVTALARILVREGIDLRRIRRALDEMEADPTGLAAHACGHGRKEVGS